MVAAQFSRDMADIAFRRVITPAVEYPLGTASFSEKQCKSIQSPILQAALRKMGYPGNFPRALVFGPTELGGVGLKEAWTERCFQHISTAIGHIRQPGRIGDMILCNLRWQQRIAGVSFHIWEHPHEKMDAFLEKGWITSGVRAALAATNCTIQFTSENRQEHLMLPALARTGDSYIMDKMIQIAKGARLYKINACRLWLRVTRLSDIVSAEGCNFRTGVLKASVSSQEICKEDLDGQDKNYLRSHGGGFGAQQ
jgi:hypothetical protein